MQAHLSEKRKEAVAVARECSRVASKVEKMEGFMEGEGAYE